MPTLVEMLATVPGRLTLLGTNIGEDVFGYTLRQTGTNNFINAEKLKTFRMPDFEKLLPLFDESVEWEVGEARIFWDSAIRTLYTAFVQEVPMAMQCDQNPDVYLKLLAMEDPVEVVTQFYNKEDDSESDYQLTTDHYLTECWFEYTLP